MLKRKQKDAAVETTVTEQAVAAPAAVEEAPKKGKKDKKAAKAEKPKKEKKAKKEKAPKAEKPKKAKKEKKSKKDGKGEKVTKKATIFGNPVRNLIVCAVVAILVGAAFLAEPKLVYNYCGYAIGGLIALVGLVYILIYFLRKPVSGVYRSEFAMGLVALLAGAYVAVGGLLTSSSSSVSSLSFATIVRILGILMVAGGILKLQYTLDIARMKYSKWWIALIMSVLGVALGVVTAMGLTYSLGSTLGMSGMDMLGIAFCLNGAFDLGVMIVVAVRNHKANKAAALAEAEAMVAAAKQEEVADFFPEEDTSAEEEAAPAEEVSSQETETIVTPEPVAQPETKPEPKPEPEPAPVVVAAAEPENPVFEPELPDPVLATPAKEDE
jgi:hypothetical protein